jgi:hypothetical protein
VKAIMRKVRNKYRVLDPKISLDALCGNRFYKNEMTVTKYLSGMIIKDRLELLMKTRHDQELVSKKDVANT